MLCPTTLVELKSLVPRLSERQFSLWRKNPSLGNGLVPNPSTGELPAREVVLCYIYEWLSHLGYLSEAQMKFVQEQLKESLAAWLPDTERPFNVVITDNVWLSWTGSGCFVHLEEETRRERLPGELATLLVCNLPGLVHNNQKRLASTRKAATEAQASPGQGR